ncbi:Zn-ribbon domain-containing OB-fold protein [Nocardia salmonicida]|uniref:Zn-ribbon domain-containing OB-fold protein n=1 Tax=Nocardia salmonicida TaxID=53431 RepID=UPI003788B1B0
MVANTVPDESVVRNPIAPGLFTWPSDEPRLISSVPGPGQTPDFPAHPGDEELLLPRTGTLYTWTTQEFPPPSPPYRGPEKFEPYFVGYVAFPEGVLVEGRIVAAANDELTIGMPMTVVVIPFRTEADGSVTMTFAFAPASEPAETEESA